MPYQQITDHTQVALDTMLGPLWESPNLRALLAILIDRLQAVEDVVEELFTERLLDNAEGAQLDDYGYFVGQPRLGLDDDAFRRLIKNKVAINNSNGEASVLVEALSVVIGEDVHYFWCGPACYGVHYEPTSGPMDPDFVCFVEETMLLLTPSGVEFFLTEGAGLGDTFIFDTFGQGFNEGLFGRRIL